VTVGEALRVERPSLRELPFWYDTAELASPRVDAKALVTIRQNHYSVPVALAGLRVQARIGAREIVISHNRREVARHLRLPGRFQTAARLDHYLELLRRKPGALQMVDVLLLCREHGPARVELAVKGALAAGAYDGRAVALLAARSERPSRLPLFDLPEQLRRADRPVPTLHDYDAYLEQGGAR
jgi:hypothetical protein